MRFLITRPAEDAAPLAAELTLRGHEPITDAVMTIIDVADPSLSLDDVQALLITSANGIRAFARAWPDCSPGDHALTVLAVGDASGWAARALGFNDVRIAGGDVDTLAAMVKKEIDPASGALVHIAGTHRAGDLSDMLSRAGFVVRRHVLYEAHAAEALGPKSADALKTGGLDGVLLYSPRTAALFGQLVADAGLADRCQAVTAFCLSAAVADKAQGLPWAGTVVAETPDQAALLQAIEAASR